MANINVSRKSGFIRRHGGMRRETIWFGTAFVSSTLANSASVALLSTLNTAALALRPFTIVRTLGSFFSFSDQSAATEAWIANIGYAIVSTEASGVGITALPTPATEISSDLWLAHVSQLGRFELVGSAISSKIEGEHYDFRSMRKVEDGQDEVITVEAGIGGSGCIVQNVGRQLVKLH